MMTSTRLSRLLISMFVWFLVLCCSSVSGMGLSTVQAADSPMEVRSVTFDPNGNLLTIQGNRKLTSSKYYTALKLPSPNRFVLDIPDAVLATSKSIIPVDRNGINEIELSESRGTFYNAVRITIYVDSFRTLNQMNVSLQEKGLVVSLTGAPVMAQQLEAPQPAKFQPPPGANLISDIYYRDDQLVIKGTDDAQLVLKNRFVLSDPNRLVLDLDRAAIINKGLLKPIYVQNSNIQQIRVGQFDEDTVRIVIEARAPERVQILYPSADKHLVAIRDDIGTSINTLPSDTQLGQVQNVSVQEDQGDTVIRLTASAPIVQRVVKEDGRIYAELVNIAANPGWIPFDRQKFAALDYIKLESLTAGQPNSKLVIDLKSSEAQVSSHLSEDGRTLEIALLGFSGFSAIPVERRSSGPVLRAPYRATVVVDPGHGGKDLGANREGINEKDLNLSVALRVKQALEARGVRVYMTRSSDVFLPLPEISRIANSYHPDLFVSIHTNSSTNPSMTGLETYYYTPQSVGLASRVHQRIVNNISSKDNGVRRAMFYVIHHTQVPSILCEMGYISNAQERSELVTDARKQRTAEAIADGVVEYLRASLSAKAR